MMNSNYSRRDFLKTVGLGAAAVTLPRWAGAAPQTAESKRPNFLFIMSDDHAAHAMSCYDSRINRTPNLDRIANEGVRFSNCFCTNSICAPSRAVILTGKYSHVNGMMRNGNTFDGAQMTFPKLLQSAGYRTAMIGKWHLNSDPTGFDHWSILPGQGNYHDPEFIEMGQRKTHPGYVTDIITDLSIDWIKNRGDQPFLLMCQHKAPHRNWQPDEKHATMYENENIPEPDTFNDDYATRCEAARHQAMTIENDMELFDYKVEPPADLVGQALKKWKYQRYIKDYLRCVASVDDNIGRLLKFLDESGLAENTIVVYTSDQGFFLGDHGWYDKRFMYEESLRMPLLVRYPGAIKPGVRDEIVLNLDFAETFLDYAGVTPPAEMQGCSMRPILEGRPPNDWRRSMYYRYYEYGHLGENHGWHRVRPHVGVRTRRHKLIHFKDDVIDAWELFDIEQDPHELKNVYADPKYAKVVDELKAELERLRVKYRDSEA